MRERLSPEQYDTLEGAPEPSENPYLSGHGEAARMLAAAYASGKLPHGLLLAGPRGVGKATFAFHFAYHLLANPSRETAPETLAAPDPASPLFRQIALGAHPAILHLTRPLDDKTKKFRTVISVDEVRRVSRFLSMTSHDGSYRVVIVDAADDLNRNAANALLKNLEEPPARTVFLLIAHSLGTLLPTIRSRCQIVRLAPLSRDDMAEAVRNLEIDLPADDEQRREILGRTGGSVRTAILLSRFGGLEIIDSVNRLAEAGALDYLAAYRLADAVSGREQEIRFDLMNLHVLERIAHAANAAVLAGQPSRAERLSRVWRELSVAIEETDTYNLDRRQHTVQTMRRLHQTLRM